MAPRLHVRLPGRPAQHHRIYEGEPSSGNTPLITRILQIYSKCFPSGNANEFCDHVFRYCCPRFLGDNLCYDFYYNLRTFDTDKNGSIDFKEFLLAIDVTSSGSPEEKLNWAFR